MAQARDSLGSALRVAAALSAFCLALLGARLWVSGHDTFAFMAWNLVLAWLPAGLSALLVAGRGGRWVQAPLLAAWLALLPNAPYLVTDLVHLGGRPAGSPWIDLVMFPLFAVVGLLIGAISLHQVHGRLAAVAGARAAGLATAAVIVLAGVGMYLGRVLRWNSWDLLTRPGLVASTIGHALADPRALSVALLVSLGWSACVGLSYVALGRGPRRSVGRA